MGFLFFFLCFRLATCHTSLITNTCISMFCFLQRDSRHCPVCAHHRLVQLLCLQTVCDCPVHGFHAAPHCLPLCSLVCSLCSAYDFLKLACALVYSIFHHVLSFTTFPGDVLLVLKLV